MANLKRTREDILASVLDTVHRKGLSATGLSELFAASGTSSGSFYNYFRSKHELGHALIDFEWSQLRETILKPALETKNEPIEKILEMIDRLEAKQLRHPECAGCLLGNLIVDLVEQDESFREHLTRIFDEWEELMTEVLDEAKPQLKPEISPSTLAEELITMIEGVMLVGRLRHNPHRIHRGFESVRNYLKSSRLF
jgi:TetR/AcrR family transcriptional repressor of nem operon